ncbi:MAG: hypothetical protein JNJ55_07330, partial [Betaproteobacteria bacterium]|nr:hypothetical protein [Betaproteobacteria bacterium]
MKGMLQTIGWFCRASGWLGILALVTPTHAQPLKLDDAFAAGIDQHLQFLEKHDIFSGAVLV